MTLSGAETVQERPLLVTDCLFLHVLSNECLICVVEVIEQEAMSCAASSLLAKTNDSDARQHTSDILD